MKSIRMSAAIFGFVCATLLGGCLEDDEPPIAIEYCFDAYSDCLDDCTGSGCIFCDAEYNNCIELTRMYR